jgi:hypothetical protein
MISILSWQLVVDLHELGVLYTLQYFSTMILQVIWFVTAFIVKKIESNGVTDMMDSTADASEDKLRKQSHKPKIFDSFSVSLRENHLTVFKMLH